MLSVQPVQPEWTTPIWMQVTSAIYGDKQILVAFDARSECYIHYIMQKQLQDCIEERCFSEWEERNIKNKSHIKWENGGRLSYVCSGSVDLNHLLVANGTNALDCNPLRCFAQRSESKSCHLLRLLRDIFSDRNCIAILRNLSTTDSFVICSTCSTWMNYTNLNASYECNLWWQTNISCFWRKKRMLHTLYNAEATSRLHRGKVFFGMRRKKH